MELFENMIQKDFQGGAVNIQNIQIASWEIFFVQNPSKVAGFCTNPANNSKAFIPMYRN